MGFEPMTYTKWDLNPSPISHGFWTHELCIVSAVLYLLSYRSLHLLGNTIFACNLSHIALTSSWFKMHTKANYVIRKTLAVFSHTHVFSPAGVGVTCPCDHAVISVHSPFSTVCIQMTRFWFLFTAGLGPVLLCAVSPCAGCSFSLCLIHMTPKGVIPSRHCSLFSELSVNMFKYVVKHLQTFRIYVACQMSGNTYSSNHSKGLCYPVVLELQLDRGRP